MRTMDVTYFEGPKMPQELKSTNNINSVIANRDDWKRFLVALGTSFPASMNFQAR